MPTHHRSCLRVVGFLFALCIFGCQQKPWMEHRQMTDAQRKEREIIMVPIFNGLVEEKRETPSIFHVPAIEGKPTAGYQRLLDLADSVRHDPVNQKNIHLYYEKLMSVPSEVNQAEESYLSFIIVTRGNHIESAELPPPIDL